MGDRLGPMRSLPRSAPAGWARSIAHATRVSGATSRSRSCPPRSRPMPIGSAVRAGGARGRRVESSQHPRGLRHRHARWHAVTSSPSCSKARRCGSGSQRRARCRCGRPIDYAMQIAHGLAAAHDNGIVHRDLKPENVFVTDRRPREDSRLRSGQADRSGGGAGARESKRRPADTQPGIVLGTIGYMAPEQVRGPPADHRVRHLRVRRDPLRDAVGPACVSARHDRRHHDGDPEGGSARSADRERHIPPGARTHRRSLPREESRGAFQSAGDLAFALEASSSRARETGARDPQSAKGHAGGLASSLLQRSPFAGRLAGAWPFGPDARDALSRDAARGMDFRVAAAAHRRAPARRLAGWPPVAFVARNRQALTPSGSGRWTGWRAGLAGTDGARRRSGRPTADRWSSSADGN